MYHLLILRKINEANQLCMPLPIPGLFFTTGHQTVEQISNSIHASSDEKDYLPMRQILLRVQKNPLI